MLTYLVEDHKANAPIIPFPRVFRISHTDILIQLNSSGGKSEKQNHDILRHLLFIDGVVFSVSNK
jgi:hypothetical protein